MDTLILKRFRNAKPKAATSEARTYEVSGRTIQVTTAPGPSTLRSCWTS